MLPCFQNDHIVLLQQLCECQHSCFYGATCKSSKTMMFSPLILGSRRSFWKAFVLEGIRFGKFLCFPPRAWRSQNAHGHFTRAILCRNLQGKCRTLISRPMFCASLRSQNAHGHFTRAILCRNLEGKCRTLISRPVYCASLRSQNAHGHFTRAILCRNLQGKCRTLISRPVFCACAVEMHMDISQEPFHGEIYRENAGRARYHLDQTPGLNTYRKNPSVWPHCLGKNNTPKKKSLKNAKEKIGRKNKKHARLCCVALDF